MIENKKNEKIAKELVEKLFPREKWERYAVGLYVAKSRTPRNKKQWAVFNKELVMAKILVATGRTVYMLPEFGTGRHPDAFVDDFFVEFKEVTGNLGIVGKRFCYAKKQCENVFLNITNNNFSIDNIYRKLRGEIISHNYDTGKIFIYFNNKLYEWNTIDIKNPH